METEPGQTIQIRPATVADTEAIRRMHAESWLATYPDDENGVPYMWVKQHTDSWLTPEALEESKGYVERAINDPEGFYRTAEHDGSVVGFVHASTNDDKTKELQAIYLHPDMFGTGLGRQLMDLAMQWVGDTECRLEVATYNSRAKRFYAKYGFEVVGDSGHLYRDKIPCVRMVRKADNYQDQGGFDEV